MKSFKSFIAESKLDSAAIIPKEHNWLSKHHTKAYTDSEDEVKITDLGLKREHDMPRLQHHHGYGKMTYSKMRLRRVALKDIHYSQPSVNVGKIRHFMTHYHPSADDFHSHDESKGLSKYEAPVVHRRPDGLLHTSDHHRLIAAHLRGDTHALVKIAQWAEPARAGPYKQVIPTKD